LAVTGKGWLFGIAAGGLAGAAAVPQLPRRQRYATLSDPGRGRLVGSLLSKSYRREGRSGDRCGVDDRYHADAPPATGAADTGKTTSDTSAGRFKPDTAKGGFDSTRVTAGVPDSSAGVRHHSA